MMKFRTQHRKFIYGERGISAEAHRDGNVTWVTSGPNGTVSNTIRHEFVSQAKAFMDTPSMVGG